MVEIFDGLGGFVGRVWELYLVRLLDYLEYRGVWIRIMCVRVVLGYGDWWVI